MSEHADTYAMSEVKQSLALAAAIVVALAISIWIMLPPAPKPVPGSAAGGVPNVRSPSAAVITSEVERQKVAWTLQQRFTAKGRVVSVTTDGPEATTFRMRWMPGAADRAHTEELKKAEPFHRELRSHGFRQLALQVGPRTIWSKDL
jgi:hypothetical protein